MSTVGLQLRELRENAGFSLRKAAVAIDIDVAILSKMERGERKFSKELVIKLAELYKTNSDKLVIDYLSEKVLYELEEEEFGLEALKVAEKQLEYKRTNNKTAYLLYTCNLFSFPVKIFRGTGAVVMACCTSL